MRFLTVFLIAVPGLALAQGIAPPATAPVSAGNMPADFYPHSPCKKPAPAPKGAPGVGDQAAMQTYNLKVKAYNAQANVFNACVRAYVDSAQRDIAHIQEVVHDAVADANRPD